MGLPKDMIKLLPGQIWGWSEEGVEPKHAAELNFNLSDHRLKLTLELARQLSAQAAGAWSLRLVAVTGYGLERDRERSAAAGFSGHLVKPINFAMLKPLLEPVVPPPGTGDRALRQHR